MKKTLLVVLLVIFMVSGCGAKEVNKSAIPLGIALDYQEQKIVFTTQLAQPSPPEKSGNKGNQFVVISSRGKTFGEAARKITLSLSESPLWSHAALLLLGENLARTDMALLMDFVTRIPDERKNMAVVVTRQATPEQVLNVKPLITPYTSTAIRDLLQTQESQLGIYTFVTLIELIDKFTAAGIDPVIPVITIDKGPQSEELKLAGMAVFKDRKMVGSLNESESRGYRFMRPKMIQGGLFVIPSPVDEGGWITLELSRSQAKISPEIKDHEIKIKIKITAEGNFYEQSGGTGNLFTPAAFKKMNELANQEIKKEISMCISKAQTLDSDILGWGQMIKSSDPKLWKEIEPEWRQIFPDVQSEIDVSFKLRRSYLTNQSFVFRE